METKIEDLSTKKLLARIGVRTLMFILAIFFIWIFFRTGLRYFTPFIVAYIVSYLILIPIIKKLSVRLRKMWSIVFVVVIMGLTLLAMGAVTYYAVREGYNFVKNWEDHRQGIYDTVQRAADFIAKRSSLKSENIMENVGKIEDKITEWVKNDLPKRAPHYAGKVGVYLPSVGSYLMAFLFFLIATYFICADFPNINENLKKIVPESLRPRLNQIQRAAGHATFGYLRAQVILSGVIALISFVVFLFMHQKYALFFALAVGIIDFIPMLGSAVVLFPWSLILIISAKYEKAVVYIILCFILFMFRRITEPKFVGDQTGLHPLVSLMSLYVGIKLGGIFGMIVAPILCLIVVELIRAGFFGTTYNDFSELIRRIMVYTEMLGTNEEKTEEQSIETQTEEIKNEEKDTQIYG